MSVDISADTARVETAMSGSVIPKSGSSVSSKSPAGVELKAVGELGDRDNENSVYYTERKNNFDANSYTIQKGQKGWGGLEQKIKELDMKAQDIEKNEDGDVPVAVREQAEKDKGGDKFGTWNGVFVSCLLNIFGVIMFLRLPWTVGQAGIWLTVIIILISNVVTTITTLSMSAICTNGEVRAGGAYYLISRSMGHRIGGPIGVLFSLGQAVAVALYVIGFCETVVLLAPSTISGDELNDIRIFGLMVVSILLTMAYIGTGWVIKLQIFLLGLLVSSILSVIIGSLGATPEDEEKGFIGISSSAASDNANPEFRDGYDFFSVFAVFFPAVTGIMAGANISGDLEDPSKNIPTGTLWAILVSTIVYIVMAVLIGAVVQREPEGAENGLYGDPLIMVTVAIPYIGGPLVLAGIFAATFSSGLASLVGAPRILMAVAQDDLIPALKPFSVVRASDSSPIRGYFLTYIVSSGCILIGSLNAIAPLISMFFMITYGLINLSTFALEISKSPSWRPMFTYYNHWVSFGGFLLCLVIMFLTSWFIALAAIFIAAALYFYIDYRDPPVNWGSANQARQFYNVEKSMMRMRNFHSHVKTFRPHVLLLSGEPNDRLHLARFVASLRKGYGITVYGNVIKGDYEDQVKMFRHRKLDHGYFEDTSVPNLKVRGFLSSVIAPNMRQGVQSLLCCSGLGVMRPNTLMVEFLDDWDRLLKIHSKIGEEKKAMGAPVLESAKDVDDWIAVIRDGFKMGMGVMVARNLKKIDWESPKAENPTKTIDVYWLVDDGGLTLLIPYIISLHDWWKHRCIPNPIRLCIVGDAASCGVVTSLVRMFRIPCEINPCTLEGTEVDSLEHYKTYSRPKVVNKESKMKDKHWKNVADLIRKESKDAGIVFCTLPYPLKGIDNGMYMSWLDALSEDQPTILIRGNNENVLTFYLE